MMFKVSVWIKGVWFGVDIWGMMDCPCRQKYGCVLRNEETLVCIIYTDQLAGQDLSREEIPSITNLRVLDGVAQLQP